MKNKRDFKNCINSFKCDTSNKPLRNENRIVSLVSLFLFLIFPCSVFSQHSSFQIEKSDLTNYRHVSTEFKFIPQEIKPLDSIKFSITEDGNKCRILGCQRKFSFKEPEIFYFPSNISRKDVKNIMSSALNWKEIEKEQLKHHFYAVNISDSIIFDVPINEQTISSVDSMRIGFSFEEMSKEFFSNKLVNFQDIVFFFVENINIATLGEFLTHIQKNDALRNPLVVVVYDNIQTPKGGSVDNRYAPPLIIIDKATYLSKIQNKEERFFAPWLYRDYRLSFDVPNELSLKTSRFYNLKMQNVTGSIDTTFQIIYEKKQLQDYVDEISLQKADSLSKLKKYSEAVKFLKERSDLLVSNHYSNSRIKERTWESIIAFGNMLASAKSENGFDSFIGVKNMWGDAPDDAALEREIGVLTQFYANQGEAEQTAEERIKITHYMVGLRNDEQFKCWNLLSNGDKSNAKGDFWSAADYYSGALKNVEDKVLKSKLIAKKSKAVFDAVDNSYASSNYSELYEHSQLYKEIVLSEFKHKFKYAIACQKTNHFAEAFTYFDQIVNDWQDQEIMTWKEAFNNLLSLLSTTSSYDRALSIAKQIFIDNRGQKVDNGKSNIKQINKGQNAEHNVIGLRLYLLNARAKHLQPLIQISPITLDVETKISTAKLKAPDEITFMGIVDRSLAKSIAYIEKEKIVADKNSIFSTNDYPLFKVNKEGTYGWLVNRLSPDKYFIIQINNLRNTLLEKDHLERINNAPFDGRNWNNLYELEEDQYFNFLSGALTAFIESGLGKGKSLKDDYWSKLSKFEYIQYLNLHIPNKPNQPFGKVFQKQDYKGTEWDNSSSTIAFYEIKLERDGRQIKDICNPLIISGKRAGVLRIGLAKR